MDVDGKAAAESGDVLAMARARVRAGPIPEWVEECTYDEQFSPALRTPLTHLLIERQVHAELGQSFVRTAARLETMHSVQHCSQWRLEFEPHTMSVTLHSIKIRRGGEDIEHMSLDRLQFLRREAGLEGFVIVGSVTLLLVLEDVRPGDILETSYTIENRPRLLPEFAHHFFTLPPGVQIGKHSFSVRYAEKRKMQWKSSPKELRPMVRSEAGGEARLIWLREQVITLEAELCIPPEEIPHPWIQVSDCPDWQTVARAVVEAWKEEPMGEATGRLLEEIQNFSPDRLARVNRAIELVQDGFRYLSVNLELGGQIPAPAETVVRRRYGDCKDLAFLLVRLLRAFGVAARPVLVNTALRKSIALMLPSPGIFTHVLVEYEVDGKKRWLDGTIPHQGGGALGRMVGDFGLGLPIDATTTELAPVPKESLPWGSYDFKESFILDTAGSPSHLAVTVVAKGMHADGLRAELANDGIDVVAKGRLQMCANRFSRATRTGQLQYRDHRETNELVLAEVFDIDGFLLKDGVHKACIFRIQGDVSAGALQPPPEAARLSPFALPFPCKRTHTIEIDFAGLGAMQLPSYQTNNEFFTFSRRSKGLPKFFRVTFLLETLKDAVPPHRVPWHRKEVEAVWQSATLQVRLPLGYARTRKRGDFGALPQEKPEGATAKTAIAQSLPIAEPPRAEAAPEPLVQTTIEEAGPAVVAPGQSREKPVFVDPLASAATATRTRPAPGRRSSTHYRPRGPRTNRKCVYSLWIFIGSFLAFTTASILGRIPGKEGIAGVLYLLVIPSFAGCLLAAILGLRECSKYPGRYSGGKVFGILTLVFGALISLMLIPAIIAGVRGVVAGAEARGRQLRAGELLKFDRLNFVFNAPGAPWLQVDARKYPGAVLALEHPGNQFAFTVMANQVRPGPLLSTERLIEMDRANVLRTSVDNRLIKDEPAVRNGLQGRHLEIIGNFQGHDFYFVHWMLATNGMVYALNMFGPADSQIKVEQEAESVWSGFKLIK